MTPGAGEDRLGVFEAERPRLRGLAYRMLGVVDDAEDVVQETWLRWEAAAGEDIENPAGWLTTVTTRLAMDRLKAASHARRAYVGPWLPEPLPGDPLAATDPGDPERQAIVAESVTVGFLTLMETLTPLERAVFLLREVFAWPHAEVARMVGRSEASVRQTARRARERVAEGRTRFRADPGRARELSEAFMNAVLVGDVERLESMMVAEVVHLSDGGADHHAARRPVRGRRRVARLMVNLAGRLDRFGGEGAEVVLHPVMVNGQAGWYLTEGDRPLLLAVATWRGDRVAAIHMIRNPRKLQAYHREWLGTD